MVDSMGQVGLWTPVHDLSGLLFDFLEIMKLLNRRQRDGWIGRRIGGFPARISATANWTPLTVIYLFEEWRNFVL
jgi:hypothetical protein